MGKTLDEIAEQLKSDDKKVKLIYAFNGVGKTRLSKLFKNLVSPNNEENSGLENKHILYYNAFTEDLFYWDNDLKDGINPKLKIQSNSFTNWVFVEQGQEQNIISYFQNYTNVGLTPHFNEERKEKNSYGDDINIAAFSEVSFDYKRGNEEVYENIKISKGEESCFIWSIFYSLLSEVVDNLNISEESDRTTDKFNNLRYIFIDDPVTSLDENHLIELAVDLASLIKRSASDLKFVLTTHNPLFYNVLYNELKNKSTNYKPDRDFKNFCLTQMEDLSYELNDSNDSPFSYHLLLLRQVKFAIDTDTIKKYHFSFLRNLLEKTATFLGYDHWGELLNPIEGESQSYIKRIINLSSHSKYSTEEVSILKLEDKRVFKHLIEKILDIYKFKVD